ncbi:unnamed protein product [Chrysodeixis includens]|uniref:Uncharacterized protein n=1 Tax=Chrysodeixis includens TaxID=689277 RepID=A0A9N8PZF2_CHRIL|nr:unnamed protein product [Chrysodeixis includens]
MKSVSLLLHLRYRYKSRCLRKLSINSILDSDKTTANNLTKKMVFKIICALSVLVLVAESAKHHHKPAFSSQYLYKHDGHHQKTFIYVHEKPKKHKHHDEPNDGSYEEPEFFEGSPEEEGPAFNAPSNEGPIVNGGLTVVEGPKFGAPTFEGPTIEGQTFGGPSLGPPTFSAPTFITPNFGGNSFDGSSNEEPASDEDVSNDGHKKHKKHKKHEKHVDYYTHPKYKFAYKVEDEHTGDKKSQHEHRHGDKVKGFYELHHPHAGHRHVHYHADKHSGFHADVKHSTHHVVPKHHH